MRFIYTICLLCLLPFGLRSQTTIDFESFGLSTGEFLNGSDGSGGFSSNNVFFPNEYTEAFDSWSGWAISATTDTETPGFNNQYSAYTGGGYEGSATYAVTYTAGTASVIELEGDAAGSVVEGFYITNSTYAALSMLNGDMFTKKFGGETGDDPDFFLLTINKYLGGELSTDSVDFYLADYRFEDNSQDYIVEDWTYVDLSSLGEADSLLFRLSSTDNGMFGMNTPAYFCIDNLTVAGMVSNNDILPAGSVAVFPNPAVDAWQIYWSIPDEAEALLYDTQGRLLSQRRIVPGTNRLDAAALSAGVYLLRVQHASGYLVRRLLKQ